MTEATSRPGSSRPQWLTALVGVIVFALLVLVQRHRNGSASSHGDGKIVAERTRESARAEARRMDREEVIATGLRQPVTADNHAAWEKVLWTMKWTNYREPDSPGPLRAMFRQTTWPEETRRLLLETAYALQPQELRREMQQVAATESNARLWAMAAAYLRRATGHTPAIPAGADEAFRSDPRVLAALAEESAPRAGLARKTPPLRDLLTWDFGGAGRSYSRFSDPSVTFRDAPSSVTPGVPGCAKAAVRYGACRSSPGP